ncbi:hypothetical protein KA005_39940 [bacterium]|nr:hypothetical protein [bacterium]
MAKQSKKKKRPTDLNLLAASIVEDATNDNPTDELSTKNPAAVALGRLGGLKGGPARAKKLTQEQRKEIARKAASARWKKEE